MGMHFFNDTKYITNLKNRQYDPDDPSYIISCDDLRLILNDICNRLKHPVTVVNVNYDSCSFMDGRVDSDASYYAIRPTCRNLRIAAGEKYCMECDYYYTRYCKELIENGKSLSESPVYFAETCKRNPPSLKNLENISYLVYDCPMLGYCEMCYPIYFKNRIIGFLVVGEILLEDKLQRRQEILRDFFGKQDDFEDPKNIFHKYVSTLKEKDNSAEFTVDCMIEEEEINIKVLEDFYGNETLSRADFKNILCMDKFSRLEKECYKEAKLLERKLEQEWNKKKQQYFEKIVRDTRSKFNEKYNATRGSNEITYEKVQEVFRTIWEAVIEIKEKFSFDFCRLYDNLPFINRKYYSEAMQNAGECPWDKENRKCDFTKALLSMSQCRNSLEAKGEENPLRCFQTEGLRNLDGNDNVVLACENLVAVFGVKSHYSSGTYKDDSYLEILFHEIGKLFLHMCADLDRISALFVQQQHEKTLHMYRHECAHLAQRIQQNNRYYSNRERYESLSQEKKDNVFSDINSTALLLQHLSTNIGLLLGSVKNSNIEDKYSKVDVRNEFNKWRAMFRLELRKKNLRIINTTARVDAALTFYTHEELLGLMLYNLIDNAVKYSYWGTNIRVEVTPDEVIVQNYGIGIENSNRPYDLYYRAKENIENYLGDGIGLYSSKRVAELLCLKLSHRCERISDYNIPFVNEALNRKLSFEGKNTDFDQAVKQLNQLNRREILIETDFYEDREYSNVSDEWLYKHMGEPTYCVTFTIRGLKEKT